MNNWLLLLPAKAISFAVAMVVAPILPLFAKPRVGAINNAKDEGTEPRLPKALAWFMMPDNSLYGDKGWQSNNPDNFDSYWGMVRWLWRNPAYGFTWGVLAKKIDETVTFEVEHSGNGLDVDKGQKKLGWFHIKASNGAFQFRGVKRVGEKVVAIDIGWLLDPYVKDRNLYKTAPLANYQLSPKLGDF